MGDTDEKKAEDLEDEEEDETAKPTEPSFPSSILNLTHSLGYDCKRLYNLCLIDDDTLVFASGNYLHYFQISSGEVTFRETISGGGIGFLTKNEHPDYQNLLTVGENGKNPMVYVYEYPSHAIRVQLSGAAKNSFTCGSYNTSGDLLATQAGHPDFMLTIWRWEKAEVVLRSKSFQNNVLHVHFSAFNPILLVSCGLSHIKFWKMARTFTGLKLQGDLGRFGKTDFSDISACCMLADENVISGCEWGNMLLWEAGLIKLEICRKGRQPCHQRPITRITYDDGEVMTIGMDGYVRIWYWETVDLADPPDDDRFVEVEPINEFYIPGCEIRSVQKLKPFDKNNFEYYAQDGHGGIWYCDLNVNQSPNPPRKLMYCHGGRIIAAQLSPISKHLITMGEEGNLFVYDYESHKLLVETTFKIRGTDLLWFNTYISNNGMELVGGFEDGVLRQLLLEISTDQNSRPIFKLSLVRAIKAHTAALTKLSVNPKNSVLATASVDYSIFMYSLIDKQEGLVLLQPMGFITISALPYFLNWKLEEPSTIAVGCTTGEVFQAKLPLKVTEDQVYLSFRLDDLVTTKSFRFVSIKSRIRRDVKRAKIKKRKDKKRARKLKHIEKLKEANPGLQIDLEAALIDSEPDEEEEPLYIPSKPNPVLWLKYVDKNTIWLSMGGYDAGYIYEIQFGQMEPIRSTLIADGDDCEIHSYLEISDYLLFGLINGRIRVNRCPQKDFRNLKDYRLFNQHTTFNGRISQILKSFDGKNIVSIGDDGNIFIYDWNGPLVITDGGPIQKLLKTPSRAAEDIVDDDYPSLEQVKIMAEAKRQREAADEHNRKILTKIEELQRKFNEIMQQNCDLPNELQVPHKETLLDERITKQIADEMQAELDDVREDMAYDLEVAQLGKQKLYDYFLKNLDHIPICVTGIRDNIKCYSFRLEKLGPSFIELKEQIQERLEREAAHRAPLVIQMPEEQEGSMPEPGAESFFFGRDPDNVIPRFSQKMLRILRRYRGRKLHEIERIFEWEKLHHQKPDANKNHPKDDHEIREAEKNLGDYKLKMGANYEPKPFENLTHKALEIVASRERLYEIQKQFNDELFKIRAQKKELYKYINKKRKRLEILQKLIPKRNHFHMEPIPEIDKDLEYPEENLIEHFKPGCGIEIKDIIYLDQTVNDLLPKPPKKLDVEKETLEQIEELDKYHALQVQSVDYIPEHSKLLKLLEKFPRTSQNAYFESDPETGDSPPFLCERRYQWINNMLDEQGNIVAMVESCIRNFDQALRKLLNKRLKFQFEVNFIESSMTTLNQEFNVMRDSEEIENTLLAKAEEAMRTRNDMQKIINASSRQIEDSRKTCDRINEQIGQIQLKFISTTKGHKFFDFLRRIFKKKYRPPKPPKEGDESSESSDDDDSSSEDENADTKSIDSSDITTIRLDESTCPSGLERSMYDLAFKLRAERHTLEQALIEQQKNIQNKRREVSALQKQMKYHEDVYDREKNTLLEFRRKRQQELNKIKVSVILKMNQIQHFNEGEDYRDLTHAVLFDASVLNQLKTRASSLELETQRAKRWHRINIVHLQRMDKDIKFMRFEIIHLEAEIKKEMKKKFGIVLNLDDLEEEVLRRHVFELETNAEDELRDIEKQIRQRKKELAEGKDRLIREIRKNTEKLNILAVLQEEKNFIDKILASQEKNYERFFKPGTLDFDRDIEKLSIIQKQQKEQIKCLEEEICVLRMKAKPLQLEEIHYEQPPRPEVNVEILTPDNEFDICPDLITADTDIVYNIPDDFTMDRVYKIVVKYFVRLLTKHMNKTLIRKYAQKMGRYLARIGYNFEGNLTDNIFNCLVEQIQTILPKKYMLHLNNMELRRMFEEILAVFNYERDEASTEELISSIYDNAKNSAMQTNDVLNTTQYILEKIFEQLVDVMTLSEFQSVETFQVLLKLLDSHENFMAKCISIEALINHMTTYCRENLVDTITIAPMRQLVTNIKNELLKSREKSKSDRCSLASTTSKQSLE